MKKFLSILFVLCLFALPAWAGMLNPLTIRDYVRFHHFIGMAYILWIVCVFAFSCFITSKLESKWQMGVFSYQAVIAVLFLLNGITDESVFASMGTKVLLFFGLLITVLSLVFVFKSKTRLLSIGVLSVGIASIGGFALFDYIAAEYNAEEIVDVFRKEAEEKWTAFKNDCELKGGHLVSHWNCSFEKEEPVVRKTQQLPINPQPSLEAKFLNGAVDKPCPKGFFKETLHGACISCEQLERMDVFDEGVYVVGDEAECLKCLNGEFIDHSKDLNMSFCVPKVCPNGFFKIITGACFSCSFERDDMPPKTPEECNRCPNRIMKDGYCINL